MSARAARPQRTSTMSAAVAGLAAALKELGHEPEKTETGSFGPDGDHVTICCGECHRGLTASIDHDAERVELTGSAFGPRCGARS